MRQYRVRRPYNIDVEQSASSARQSNQTIHEEKYKNIQLCIQDEKPGPILGTTVQSPYRYSARRLPTA
jgi:hypothetical protein